MKTYHSVSILPGSPCCKPAGEAQGRKILSSEAPKLPLDECTMPERCRCRFHKHSDRREGDDDRRLLGHVQRSVWYGGAEKRKSRGRRTDDT
jgi:hypothetical protein